MIYIQINIVHNYRLGYFIFVDGVPVLLKSFPLLIQSVHLCSVTHHSILLQCVVHTFSVYCKLQLVKLMFVGLSHKNKV